MKFLTEEEAESRLSTPSNLVNKLDIKVEGIRSNPNSAMRFPRSIQVAAGALALQTGKVRETAKLFGLSSKSVDHYKKGVTQNDGITVNPEFREEVRAVAGKIEEKASEIALDVITRSMGFITDDKLADAKAVDLSGIARNISSVHRNLNHKDVPAAAINVMIHAPRVRNENEYDVIEVNSSKEK